MTLKSFHADVNIGDIILYRRFPGVKETGTVRTKWHDWVETDDCTISRKQILEIIPATNNKSLSVQTKGEKG